MIEKINHGIDPHRSIPIQVRNKTTWNQLFDKISRGELQNIIVVLTSNKSLEEINKIDPAYLREGRVNHYYSTS